MERATISQLKNRLSAYLKRVRAGHSILILDRDVPVARLDRVGPGERADDRLTRLERLGQLRRSTRKLSMAALQKAPRAKASVVEALLAERREGR